MKSKQVIIIRKDLNMRKGKMIAQGAHASMKVFLDRCLVRQYPCGANRLPSMRVDLNPAMFDWVKETFTKITVYVNSEEELKNIYQKALDANIICSLIEDNGLTEFHGIKTLTAVAIGPAWEDEIDVITKHLPLL